MLFICKVKVHVLVFYQFYKIIDKASDLINQLV